MLTNRKDREFDLLPNRAIENFWEAIGSSCGRFDQGAMPGVTQCLCRVFDAPPLCYGVQFWGHHFGFNRPPPIPGVLYLLGLDCGICGMLFVKLCSILLGVAILG